MHTKRWAVGAVAMVLAGMSACDGTDAANAVVGSKNTAEHMKAKMQMRAFADAIKAQELSTGHYPTSLEELAVEGAIKPSDLKDPWGHDYIYAPPETTGDDPTLYSMGPDGEAGTADDLVHEWTGG